MKQASQLASKSSARQPGQPLPGVLDFGQAGAKIFSTIPLTTDQNLQYARSQRPW